MGLRQVGHQIIQADNGEQAIRLCRHEPPELAILDVRMPGLSGIEVARILRDSTSIPFIFLSAFNDAQIVQDAIDAGALGYLVKPIKISLIVPAIEVALTRADERTKLETSNADLLEALKSNRVIDTAIGIIMERHHIARSHAFDAIRGYARTHRLKALRVAEMILNGESPL
ncbi:putative transcriptional regulatory protein pdtaR [Ferriphaselus amnicola]|uniref:Putative transcriptional regulatory protein pdtaR n=2 Tax=Ferriphaselus amnicola TaxID=1188319 RepID=A0A2Z6GC49_9PROT|nr:putative transcriptional regulatory protein pdtaR [Ferriphaselus amnicola]